MGFLPHTLPGIIEGLLRLLMGFKKQRSLGQQRWEAYLHMTISSL